MVTVPPVVVGLICADRMLPDSDVPDISLIGVFQGRKYPSFPTQPVAMVVLVMVTGGRGEGKFELSVYCLDKNGDHNESDWIYRKRKPCMFPAEDPNRVLNISIPIKSLRFPQPGDYLFVLKLDGNFIAERRILVHLEK